MFQIKKLMVPVMVTAMALSALTACGGKDEPAANTTAATEATTAATTAATTETTTEATTEAATEAEKAASSSVDEYLEQVDTMNKAAEEFITISMEFMQMAQEDPENTDALAESIEKTRDTKKAFADFAVLEAVPEGMEEAHERLAKAAQDYADTLEVYCDVLLASIKGEEHEAMATIQDDWTKVATELSEAMTVATEAAEALK